MQLKKLSGIVIGIRPQGDMDRVVSVFSKEFGKLRVIAKGVRKIGSQRSYHLDLLNFVQMELEECGTGSSRPLYLREVSGKACFLRLKKHPPSFSAACLISAFLDRLIPENTPQKTLFALTKRTLAKLDQGDDPRETLFFYFLKATRNLGYLPPVLPKHSVRETLKQTLTNLDPQFTLNARRTLGIFSNFESTRSS